MSDQAEVTAAADGVRAEVGALSIDDRMRIEAASNAIRRVVKAYGDHGEIAVCRVATDVMEKLA